MPMFIAAIVFDNDKVRLFVTLNLPKVVTNVATFISRVYCKLVKKLLQLF